MADISFKVPNISCGHCVMRVKKELDGVAGVQSVDVDLETTSVSVTFDAPATWERLRDALIAINYPPAE